jgi:hypothetical protein
MDEFNSLCNLGCINDVMAIVIVNKNTDQFINYVMSGISIAFKNNNATLCVVFISELNDCDSRNDQMRKIFFSDYFCKCFETAIDKKNWDVMKRFLSAIHQIIGYEHQMELIISYALKVNAVEFIELALWHGKHYYENNFKYLVIQTICKESKQQEYMHILFVNGKEHNYCDIIIGLLKGTCEQTVIQPYWDKFIVDLETEATAVLPISTSVSAIVSSCLQYRDDINLFFMFYNVLTAWPLQTIKVFFRDACAYNRINVINWLMDNNPKCDFIDIVLTSGPFMFDANTILRHLVVNRQCKVKKKHIQRAIMAHKEYMTSILTHLNAAIFLLEYINDDEMAFHTFIIPESSFIYMKQKRINPKILNNMICELNREEEDNKFIFYRNEYVTCTNIQAKYHAEMNTSKHIYAFTAYFTQYNDSLLVRGSSYIREYNIWINSMCDIFSIDFNLPMDLCNIILL